MSSFEPIFQSNTTLSSPVFLNGDLLVINGNSEIIKLVNSENGPVAQVCMNKYISETLLNTSLSASYSGCFMLKL